MRRRSRAAALAGALLGERPPRLLSPAGPPCTPAPQAADDYRFDAKLRVACESSVNNLCADVEQGEGRALDCLVRGWARKWGRAWLRVCASASAVRARAAAVPMCPPRWALSACEGRTGNAPRPGPRAQVGKTAQLGWGCMDQLLRFQKEVGRHAQHGQSNGVRAGAGKHGAACASTGAWTNMSQHGPPHLRHATVLGPR